MTKITVLGLLFAAVLCVTAAPQSSSLAPMSSPPEGFTTASSTADHEPRSQKGPCTACPGGIATIGGPPNIMPGIFTAAGGPSIFGPANSCGSCGDCYEMQNSGAPFCPTCGGKVQSGPRSIHVMVTNQCEDCVPSSTKGQFHFDILNPPSGWDNPNVFFRKVASSNCLGSSNFAA